MMALSNIFREPRREITESVIGTVVVGTLICADYGFACWFEGLDSPTKMSGIVFLRIIGMIFGFVIMVATVGLTFLAHAIGNSICNIMARGGLDPRPRQRY